MYIQHFLLENICILRIDLSKQKNTVVVFNILGRPFTMLFYSVSVFSIGHIGHIESECSSALALPYL